MSSFSIRPVIAGMVCLAVLSCGALQAADRTLVKLNVFPPEVKLKTAKDRQSIVVQAVYADGVTEDVTSQSILSVHGPASVRVAGKIVYPVADGKTELKCNYGGKEVKIRLLFWKRRMLVRLVLSLILCPS